MFNVSFSMSTHTMVLISLKIVIHVNEPIYFCSFSIFLKLMYENGVPNDFSSLYRSLLPSPVGKRHTATSWRTLRRVVMLYSSMKKKYLPPLILSHFLKKPNPN